jgi:hypothetical protein
VRNDVDADLSTVSFGNTADPVGVHSASQIRMQRVTDTTHNALHIFLTSRATFTPRSRHAITKTRVLARRCKIGLFLGVGSQFHSRDQAKKKPTKNRG